MPALNFTVFIDKVTNAEKRQTIRKKRKNPIKKGDLLYFYTGKRTKNCRQIRPAEFCDNVMDLFIHESGQMQFKPVPSDPDDFWTLCTMEMQEDIAKRDGFETFAEMFEWFEKTHELPGTFQLIQW